MISGLPPKRTSDLRVKYTPHSRAAFPQKTHSSCLRALGNTFHCDGIHRPVTRLPLRNEGSDADDRVADVLWKLVTDRLADFHVGLAGKIVAQTRRCRAQSPGPTR
jgi:hypothetical protein